MGTGELSVGSVGRYRTRDGRVAVIERVGESVASGKLMYGLTWYRETWRRSDGHWLMVGDKEHRWDLVERVHEPEAAAAGPAQ